MTGNLASLLLWASIVGANIYMFKLNLLLNCSSCGHTNRGTRRYTMIYCMELAAVCYTQEFYSFLRYIDDFTNALPAQLLQSSACESDCCLTWGVIWCVYDDQEEVTKSQGINRLIIFHNKIASILRVITTPPLCLCKICPFPIFLLQSHRSQHFNVTVVTLSLGLICSPFSGPTTGGKTPLETTLTRT